MVAMLTLTTKKIKYVVTTIIQIRSQSWNARRLLHHVPESSSSQAFINHLPLVQLQLPEWMRFPAFVLKCKKLLYHVLQRLPVLQQPLVQQKCAMDTRFSLSQFDYCLSRKFACQKLLEICNYALFRISCFKQTNSMPMILKLLLQKMIENQCFLCKQVKAKWYPSDRLQAPQIYCWY